MRARSTVFISIACAAIVGGSLAAPGARAATNGEIAIVASDGSSDTARGHSSIILIRSGQRASAATTKVLVTAPGRIDDLQWTPDGKTLVYRDDRDVRSEVFAFDLASSKRTLLVGTMAIDDEESLAPDGRTLAYTDVDGDAVHLVGIDGRSRRKLGSGLGPSWSANSKRLALVTGANLNRIVAIGADGSGTKLVVQFGATKSVDSIAWAPNGKSLLLEIGDIKEAAGIAASSTIETISLSGRVLHVLSTVSIDAPSWSPDGAQIAFEQLPAAVTDPLTVVVENADGSGRRTVDTQTGSGDGFDISWSPDGRSIVTTDHFQQVRVVHADGTHPQVIDAPGTGRYLDDPAWQPLP